MIDQGREYLNVSVLVNMKIRKNGSFPIADNGMSKRLFLWFGNQDWSIFTSCTVLWSIGKYPIIANLMDIINSLKID